MMMTMRESLSREIADILMNLNAEIKLQNARGRTDLNYEAEDIYCSVLNIVLGCNLQSIRQPPGVYQAIDLVDDDKGLAVQVTSNNSRLKIQHTLDQFFHYEMDTRYNRLIFLLIGKSMQYRKTFEVKSGFHFEPSRDIWDESRLMHEIFMLDVERLKRLRDYLWSRMNGLGLQHPERDQSQNVHQLDEIIRDRIFIKEAIDESLLHTLTIHFDYEYLTNGIDLKAVNHLFVIASPKLRKQVSIEKGGYISRDNTWLLLHGLPSDQVASIIDKCTNLTSLVISNHEIEELSLGHARKLKNLEIIANKNPVRFSGTGFLAVLERLYVYASQLTDPLDLQNAVQLRELKLGVYEDLLGNEINIIFETLITDCQRNNAVTSVSTGWANHLKKLSLKYIQSTSKSSDQFIIRDYKLMNDAIEVTGLDWCRSLETLSLSKSVIDVIDLDRLGRLKKLSLTDVDTEIHAKKSHDHLTELLLNRCTMTSLSFLHRMKVLKALMLLGVRTHTRITSIPDLSFCENLTKLILTGTKLHSLGKLPPLISELSLRDTGLTKIPDQIRPLKQLKKLDLSRLYLRELPLWLADLGLSVRLSDISFTKGILMEGTSVEGVDLRTIPEQRELLKEWLEALHDAREQIQNEVKVIFLGDGEAGKSHIIKRLENNGVVLTDFDGDATPGIAITNKELDLADRSVTVRAWDFGGQEILHAMHRIFMTEQTLYVVVLNARNDTQDHRAEHWLRFIYSFDKDAQVMLVLNKIDQNPRASINLNRLKRLFPDLPDVVRMSAKKDSPKEFTEHFIKPLRQQLERFEVLKSPFPESWRRLEEKLESVKKRYIWAEDYEQFCEELGISKAEVRNELLCRFENLGVCFRCDGEWSDAFLLLEPKWVTNAIYKILFNQHKMVTNGIIGAADIKTCLTYGDKQWSVDRNLAYSRIEINYILQVMRSYGLSFDMDDKREFIPMLCDRNESPLVKEYTDDPTVLEIWWQFDYLPDNLLFHLMVELSGELDTDNVWLNGARFRDPYTQHCMIVERDGSTLKLYAENKPGMPFAREHMEGMERNIRKVIDARFPGMVEVQHAFGTLLAPPTGWKRYPCIQRLLVHKLNGKRETFDLNRLEDNPNCPQHSKLLKTTILAKDLLERCYRGMDPEQSMLIQDLTEGCMAVQGNNSPHENPRNTYVRDILQAKHYDVRDQTLCGKAEGKTEAGELDMEIRRDSGKAWTIFEALNHSDYDYWRRHLNKLLANYNPHGLKMLFLVVYVDNKDFSTITGRYSNLVKTYAPEDFKCIGESAEELTDIFARDAQGIKIWRCNYDSGVCCMTVYHIFVHMEESTKPQNPQKGSAEKSSEKDEATKQTV